MLVWWCMGLVCHTGFTCVWCGVCVLVWFVVEDVWVWRSVWVQCGILVFTCVWWWDMFGFSMV